MLTVDFDRFPIGSGDRVLDVGCGGGRHAFEALRRSRHVVALDLSSDELPGVAAMTRAMRAAGECAPSASGSAVRADVLRLPFRDGAFDRVIASEILEHVPDDAGAMAEVARVLRPDGLAAVTVPRWWPERVCWAISARYHQVAGGHVRIYGRELVPKLRGAGFEPIGRHHAHALHSPYWWLRCAVGIDRTDHAAVKAYHRMLVWDIERRPRITRTAERLLNPVLGKSLVLYLRKRVEAQSAVRGHVAA
ncbi:MAG: class I SAM-dependent methyltransferase [Actinomycetota bacterium]